MTAAQAAAHWFRSGARHSIRLGLAWSANGVPRRIRASTEPQGAAPCRGAGSAPRSCGGHVAVEVRSEVDGQIYGVGADPVEEAGLAAPEKRKADPHTAPAPP